MKQDTSASVEESVEGFAFGRLHRWFGLLVAAALLATFIELWRTNQLGTLWSVWLAGLIVVEVSAYWIWKSRVYASREMVRQTWLWDKCVKRREISYANVVRVRRLEWLVAPRLVTRAGAMGLTTINIGDRRVLMFVERHYLTPLDEF